MASIWLLEKGHEPRKVDGSIPAAKVVSKFHTVVAKAVADTPGLKVLYHDDMLARLAMPNGDQFALQVEVMSPPTAPEKGQPKRLPNGRGVVVDSRGVPHTISYPPEPEPAL